MAKKKNNSKKHRFKNVESPPSPFGSTPAVDSQAKISTSETRARVVAPKLILAAPERDFSYVSGDLRRIGMMAVALIGVELILNYVLLHTALGTAIYQLVKV